MEKLLSAANNKISELIEDVGYCRKKIYHLEKNLNIINQYSRRANVEITGIPDSVPQAELENTVLGYFHRIGLKISSYDLVSCHRLKNVAVIGMPIRLLDS